MATRTLPAADYTDTFAIAGAGRHGAEEWARAAFESSPRDDWKAQLVWRGALQLRLGGGGTPDRVAGWQVVENSTERLVVAAASWHLRAWLVWEADADGVRVTTRLAYRSPAGRAVWTALGPVHRRAVPGLLAAARRRLPA